MSAPSQTSELTESVASAGQLVPALRSAAAAGLVAFGLCFPIISYHAESNMENELVLIGRWPLSFAIAALVFLFVFLRQMARADWRIWFDRVGSIAAGGIELKRRDADETRIVAEDDLLAAIRPRRRPPAQRSDVISAHSRSAWSLRFRCSRLASWVRAPR